MKKMFVTNFVIAGAIAGFLAPYYPGLFFFICVLIQVITHVACTASTLMGNYLKKYISPVNLPTITILSMLMAMAASAATFPVYFLFTYLSSSDQVELIFSSLGDYAWKATLPAFIVTSVMRWVRFTLEARETLQNKTSEEKSASTKGFEKKSEEESRTLSFRSASESIVVPYQDILYLRAEKMKTMVYTINGDFTGNHMLKDLEARPPQSMFMRIHKKYMVNLSKVCRLQYLTGGYYLAHLQDDDDTQVTVGRAFAQALKLKLKIS